MTDKEFERLRPGKSIVKVLIEDEWKTMLFKSFLCYTRENYDGYWMLCTEDLTNPYPDEIREDDWDVYSNCSEVIEY